MTYEKDPSRLTHSLHNLKVLYDAGIPIAMGTDNMLENMTGAIEHRELAYYVEAGLSPMEAIVLATRNSAEHLGVADRKGLVREGIRTERHPRIREKSSWAALLRKIKRDRISPISE